MLLYGQQQGFPENWADSILRKSCEDGTPAYSFSYLTNLNRPISDGKSPLMIAAANGHWNLVLLFLSNDADPQFLSEKGPSAAELAREAGFEEIATLLSMSKLEIDDLQKFLGQIRQLAHSIDKQSADPNVLLASKFPHLQEYRIDIRPMEGEIFWFRVNDKVNFALVENSHYERAMINGKRIIDWDR